MMRIIAPTRIRSKLESPAGNPTGTGLPNNFPSNCKSADAAKENAKSPQIISEGIGSISTPKTR